jgi:PGDYG protein
MALKLENPDLAADDTACWVVKDEIVRVEFALAAGVLESAVGFNRYAAGDALLTGSTGDRWCVSRDRFDVKYRPEPLTLPGEGGSYRNRPVALRAKRMSVAFSIARSAGGDVLLGDPGDWLLQYAPGDHGVVAQARFDKVYRVLDAPGALRGCE